MSYQVLARKCRPQRFSEIVGQQHITRTLQNAISHERVGHAYLFVGPRGTGKTTTARIFAKALNCEKGLVTEPCCECRSCLEIANGSSLDVMEIDGASHNKVEHVRDLRDNVQYTPNQSRYKIYIIDEVHMLTTQAWNALLKTLEEPPPHVKFFFATTEPHKVLPTIVSRCQRFDLKRLSVPLIAGRLKEIAASENIAIDERALVAIARAADGAMRDGQSIFDQIIAFCGTGQNDQQPIAEEDVINVFGLASGRELTDLAKAAAANDVQGTVQILHDLAERGRDLERLFGDLILFLRNVMIFQVCTKPEDILDVSDAELSDIREVAEAADPKLVQRLLEGLTGEEGRLRNALNKRVYLEVALVQVMHQAHDLEIDKLISRLNELRGTELPGVKKNDDRNDQPPASTSPPVATAAQPKTTAPPASPQAAATPDPPAATQTPAPVPDQTPVVEQPQKDADRPAPPEAAEAAAPYAETAAPPPPKPQPEPETTSPETRNPKSETRNPTPETRHPKPETRHPKPEPPPQPEPQFEHRQPAAATANQGAAPSHAPRPPEPAAPTTQEPVPEKQPAADASHDPAMLWHHLIEAVNRVPEKHQLKTYMQELRPVDITEGRLQVAYDNEFPEEHVKLLLRTDNFHVLENALRRITGNNDAQLLLKRWVEGVSTEDRKRRLVSSPEIRERLEHNPFVQKIQHMFNAEIIDVRG